uniref:Zinc finger protein 750 n=1 Tax=Zeugodacus cucurbitae TaxID=28588 RepID=A0A0A1WU23_ZEUCU
MDFGDGVTVNLCSAVDCTDGDNGPKLTIPKSPGLQLDVHSSNDEARPTGNVQVTLLHPQSREMLAEMQRSIRNVGDSSNSRGDIVMLDSNDCNRRMPSTYEDKENIPDNETFISLKKHADFAVFSTSSIEPIGPILKSAIESKFEPDIVKVPKQQQSPIKTTNLQHRESISCGIEESTEVLLVNSSECDDKYFGNSRTYSGTDSDIEVLMSEEIVDSDWSAGNAATDELGQTPVQNIGAVKAENSPQICSQNQINQSKNVKESTDQEISVENSSCSSLSNSEQTGKDQLLKVISEQATYIQSLESTIARYRESYKTLLEHVDALRLALDVKNIEDGNVKLEINGIDRTARSRDVIKHN